MYLKAIFLMNSSSNFELVLKKNIFSNHKCSSNHQPNADLIFFLLSLKNFLTTTIHQAASQHLLFLSSASQPEAQKPFHEINGMNDSAKGNFLSENSCSPSAYEIWIIKKKTNFGYIRKSLRCKIIWKTKAEFCFVVNLWTQIML